MATGNKTVEGKGSRDVSKLNDIVKKIVDRKGQDSALEQLDGANAKLLQRVVLELKDKGYNEHTDLENLWKYDYVRKPPTMKEFLEDEYWLGKVMNKSDESNGLYPKWKELLIRDFDLDSRVHNLLITGSLGSGKTFVSISIMLYRIALARLLKSPQSFFGLSAGSSIYFILLSVTRNVVEQTAYADICNFMRKSTFFTEYCKFNVDKQYKGMNINLGNNIFISAGSKSWHTIGRNTMGILLDEGNFRNEAKPNEAAYKLYDDIRTRLRNRFQKTMGYLPSISILSSSAKDESSFTEKVRAEIKNPKSRDADQRIYSFAVYVIRPEGTEKGRWFRVSYGLLTAEPTILRGWYLKRDGAMVPVPALGESDKHEEVPQGSQIEYVPERYISDFERNTGAALQNVSGIPTGSSFRFIPQMLIERAISSGERDGLEAPCQRLNLPISQEDNLQIWDYLDHKKFVVLDHSMHIPKRDPYSYRFCHLDLARRSQGGLSIGHIVGKRLVEGLVNKGEVYNEYRMFFEYDFILSIVPGKNKPISLDKIINFLIWLKDMCGFKFARVTADNFDSQMPLELLSKAGFNTAKLSLDRDKKAYYAFRSALEEDRVRMFRHPILVKEINELVDLPDKVDHPMDGSKDIADSVAGAYYSAVLMKDDDLIKGTMFKDPGLHPNETYLNTPKGTEFINPIGDKRAVKEFYT